MADRPAAGPRELRDVAGLGKAGIGVASTGIVAPLPTATADRRLLVPVDVQALYVPEGHEERFVQLPFALAGADGDEPPPMPDPFADGGARPPGVHLRWAPPDALLRGRLAEPADGEESNRLALPPLPDRWVVLRILAPKGSTDPAVRGWVLEADAARATPLERWPEGAAEAPQLGRAVPPGELTGSAGGSPAWTAVYDAGVGRFGFHDPLDDLEQAAPKGATGDLAVYVVAGWYSDPERDPLAGEARSMPLFELLDQLGWTAPEDFETAGAAELPRASLLHGEIHGVPVRGEVVADQRPDAGEVRLALGGHETDLAATLASLELAGEDAGDRRSLERVLSGFTAHLLARIGAPDGLIDIEEHEHAGAFASRPGGQGPRERLRAAGEAGPLPAGQTARSLAAKPPKPSKRRREQAGAGFETLAKGRAFSSLFAKRIELPQIALPTAFARSAAALAAAAGEGTAPSFSDEPRAQRRSAPRFHHPIEPLLAVRGPKRSLIQHGDGRFNADGKLTCRWPSQVGAELRGVLHGSELIGELGGEGLPEEVLLLARSALVGDPYLSDWIAAAIAARRAAQAKPLAALLGKRLRAEAAIRFGRLGVVDAGLPEAAAEHGGGRLASLALAERFRFASLFPGVEVDPVGTTAWSQPWVPLFLEWEVEAAVSKRFDEWRLGPVDLDPPEGFEPGRARKFSGRSPLGAGPAKTLSAAIDAWLVAEEERDRRGGGEADEATEEALDEIGEAIENLDILAASLDSLHDQLLGLPVGPYGVLSPSEGEGGESAPKPVGAPQLTVAGELRVTRARLVDAFGRVLDLPVETVRVPTRSAAGEDAGRLRVRPRLLRPARWMFRLVDPAGRGEDSPEASIDQVEPEKAVNPVAGFLLPDHVDEALEAFDTSGRPLGQLMHEPFGGGVLWEIAPGREGPPDAPPGHGLEPAQQIVGDLAAALVAADAQARQGEPAGGGEDSALTALLRAIDTTLWSVDSFASFGNEHVAGLVGRPVAVVRALLRLELDDDLDDLDLGAARRRTAREKAYEQLRERPFTVRIGELTRVDDGLLGFFVDDDYSRMRVVDKAVRDGALDGGRMRGQLGFGETPQVPPVRPIDHPYIEAEDELTLRLGQTVRLTLLMHPMGKVHLTSGILPRKALQLARDWVNPGLATMSPSVRVGPVLIEPGEVRLPKVSSFPKDQLWTRRDSPSTWRDDPIVAATQAALLPEQPAGIEEGYIRVAPRPQGEGGDGGS